MFIKNQQRGVTPITCYIGYCIVIEVRMMSDIVMMKKLESKMMNIRHLFIIKFRRDANIFGQLVIFRYVFKINYLNLLCFLFIKNQQKDPEITNQPKMFASLWIFDDKWMPYIYCFRFQFLYHSKIRYHTFLSTSIHVNTDIQHYILQASLR